MRHLIFDCHCLLILRFRETALQQLQELACAPSVPLQDVPSESLRQHLGFGRDDEEARDEIDERLARKINRPLSHLLIIELKFQNTPDMCLTSKMIPQRTLRAQISGIRTSQDRMRAGSGAGLLREGGLSLLHGKPAMRRRNV